MARRAILYSRVSLGNGEQDSRMQDDALEAFANARGWYVAARLTDEAGSTNHRKRKAWQEALRMAEAGEADVIAVWRLDRGFRSLRDMLDTTDALKKAGVALVSVQEPWLDTRAESASGELVLNIMASVAQFERRLLKERTAAAMARVKKYGTKTGRPVGWPRGRSRKGQGVGRKRGVPEEARG